MQKNSNSPENFSTVPAKADASLPLCCRLRLVGIQNTFGRVVKTALSIHSFWIKRFIIILDYAGGKTADLHTKNLGQSEDEACKLDPHLSVLYTHTNKSVLWEIISVGNCWWSCIILSVLRNVILCSVDLLRECRTWLSVTPHLQHPAPPSSAKKRCLRVK